jgi:hypothetical protein
MPTSPGDPEGRRLSRKRAAQLAEAGRLIRIVEALLNDAEFDTAPYRGLAEEIRTREQAELMKAHGRLAPRKRFRHQSGQPLHEKRTSNLLFIDESGVSHPEKQQTKAFFVLGAVALHEEHVPDYCSAADDLKRAFFGTTDMTLHEPAMRRFDGPYHFGGDTKKQQAFDQAVNELIERTPFVAFGVGIDKMGFADEFVRTGLDPYLPLDVYTLAVVMLLERYVDFLATSSGGRLGRVTFESQGPKEDAAHQLEYARVLVHGTQWMPPSDFQHGLEAGVRFRPKYGSDPLELADILARDLYEWVASDCEGSPHRWHVFNPKIYCRDDRQMGKFGIKVFPDSRIRDKIEAHRKQAGPR